MNLTKWEALSDVEDIFDQYLRRFGEPLFNRMNDLVRTNWRPRVDISETDKEFIIKGEIPDVNKEDVKVSIDEGVLSIKGERKQEVQDDNKKYHRIERHYGSFTRSFRLPENVDANGIKANFKDGMLVLNIPKTGESKPKSLAIPVE